jgi:serine/threonine protein kinase
MAVSTVDEFFAVLEKSRLLTSAQLAQARDATGNVDDPTAIARTLARQELITRWQAGQLLAGRSVFYLGKYRLIELLGRGGMGNVFLGQHVMMNRRVALKIISRQVGKDHASLDRFLAEARAVASLDHPNIVQAYNVDNEGDRYYLVMEYVEGLDLQRLVELEGPLDSERAADYVRQAADGLEHAHQRNMIHCDIKPSNLLVNSQGVVKILDMGLARLTDRDESGADDQDERVLGSVDYMPPEQALKDTNLDGRADLYSLGCTLYFLLTGHPPFSHGTLPERILKHQTQEPPSIRSQRRDVPADLAAICAKMMAKKREDRYQTAEEASRALTQWRPSAAIKRVVVIPRAEPLDDSLDAGFLGIDFDEDFRRKPSAKSAAGKERRAAAAKPSAATASASLAAEATTAKTRLKAIAAGLFATPKRIAAVAVVGALAVIALAALAVTIVVLSRSDRAKAPLKSAPTEQEQPAAVVAKPVKPKTEPPKTENPKPEPPKTEPPKTEPPKTEPPKTEPPKTEPPKTEPPKTEPPKTEPPKTEEPKKVEPLAELAEAVDVPAIGPSGGPVSLGKIYLPPGTLPEIKLLGGKTAAKSGLQFDLKPSSDAANPGWLIQAIKGKANEPEANDVARITVSQQQELTFQWLDEAPERANYLRNCGLLVSVAEKHRFIALRSPQPAKPLTLDFDRGKCDVSLPAKWLPDVAVLQLAVKAKEFEGKFPPHKFIMRDPTVRDSKLPKRKPGAPMDEPPPEPKERSDTAVGTISAKERLQILFTKNDTPDVGVLIAFAVKKEAINVSLVTLFEVITQGQSTGAWFPLSALGVNNVLNTAAGQQRQLEAVVGRIPDKDPRKPVCQKEIESLKKVPAQVEALKTAYQPLHNVGKIHFRVFIPVGEPEQQNEITLFQTKAAAEPADDDKPAAQKPPAKRGKK